MTRRTWCNHSRISERGIKSTCAKGSHFSQNFAQTSQKVDISWRFRPKSQEFCLGAETVVLSFYSLSAGHLFQLLIKRGGFCCLLQENHVGVQYELSIRLDDRMGSLHFTLPNLGVATVPLMSRLILTPLDIAKLGSSDCTPTDQSYSCHKLSLCLYTAV